MAETTGTESRHCRDCVHARPKLTWSVMSSRAGVQHTRYRCALCGLTLTYDDALACSAYTLLSELKETKGG